MDQHQPPEGEPANRQYQPPQPTETLFENNFQVDAWLFGDDPAWPVSHQLVPQAPLYNYNHNEYSFLPPNASAMNCFDPSAQLPLAQPPLAQLPLAQLPPAQLHSAQLHSAQLHSAQLHPAQLHPAQFTGFDANPNMGFGLGPIENNILNPYAVSAPIQPLAQAPINQNTLHYHPMPETFQHGPTDMVLTTVPLGVNMIPNGPMGGHTINRAPAYVAPRTYRPKPPRPKRSVQKRSGADKPTIPDAAPGENSKPSNPTNNSTEAATPTAHTPAAKNLPTPIPAAQSLLTPDSTQPVSTQVQGLAAQQSSRKRGDGVAQPQPQAGTPAPRDSAQIRYDHMATWLTAAVAVTSEKTQPAAQGAEKAANSETLLGLSGGVSGYPAETFEDIRLPGCEYRAKAICVGSPRPEWVREHDRQQQDDHHQQKKQKQRQTKPQSEQARGGRRSRWVVFAVRAPGADGVVFKSVEAHASVDEVLGGSDIEFGDVRLNEKFSDMDEKQVSRWSRYLLAAVPGVDDQVTMWARG